MILVAVWRVAITLVLAGCGRIGFDSSADATTDSLGVLEATGGIDPGFGTGGSTTTSDGQLDVIPYEVLTRPDGYLVVGTHGDLAGSSAIAILGFTKDGFLDTAVGGDGLVDVGPTANDFGYGAARIDDNRVLVVGDGDANDGRADDLTIGIVGDQGVPDPAFGSGGFVRIDPDGMGDDTVNAAIVVGSKAIVCGVASYSAADSHFVVAAIELAGGALDPGFGTGGRVLDNFMPGVQDECNDLVALGTNVIAVGHADGDRLVVAAYDASGARIPTFANGGVFQAGTSGATAYDVALVDGDLVIAGEDAGAAFAVRLAPDGTRRASFGTNGEVSLPAIGDLINVVVPQPNGKLLVAGKRGSTAVIARLLGDGRPDPTFGAGGVVVLVTGAPAEVQSLLLEPGGKIVAIAVVGAASPFSSLITRLE